jgi:hypothetical protein
VWVTDELWREPGTGGSTLVEPKVNRTALSFCLLDAYEPSITIISKGRVVTVSITIKYLKYYVARGLDDSDAGGSGCEEQLESCKQR